MNKMVIHGGNRLKGEVVIGGAKNSTVALIPAAILADTPVKLDMVPNILDVNNLMIILESMNVKSDFSDGVLKIDPTKIKENVLPSKAIKSLRASYYFMGALLGRFHKAEVSFPGGDDIGPRPIEQHLQAFKALGAEITESKGTVTIDATKNGLHGANIFLDIVSVGATINAILAAVKASGSTTIQNAAREPEITDIVMFLNSMGAHIKGAGTDVIKIEGTSKLIANTVHTVIPDRIEAGTYLSMAAAIGDGVLIKNVIPEHLEAYLAKLNEAGVKMNVREDSIYVEKSDKLNGIEINTAPFPGFATDLQQPLTPLLLRAESKSVIHDTIYPKRTKHVSELQSMGANVVADEEQQIITINHTNELSGTTVSAGEIRAGASLFIAGLMANGTTTINNADNILRGYDNIVLKLRALNADVEINDD